jgi:PST family polysaccharide transporter
VAILLAVRGFGVWAIAWAGVAQSAVRAGLMIAQGGWRPALAWDLAALRDLIGFGAGLTVKRFINYSAANVDYFVIGRRLGPDSLGFYTRAYGLMTLPLTQLSRVIMTVLFPAFSRIQDDNRRLVAGYARVVNATALVAFPFLVGLMLVAPAFIHVVYGKQWMPAVLPLQIMCIAGMMKAVSTFVGSIVDAKGKIGAEVRRQLVYLALLVAGTLLGSRWGTVGVAVAVVAASLAMLVMMQSLLGELTGMRWRTYLGALAPALAGSAVMAAAVAGFQALAGPGLGLTSPALLASSTAVGAGTYILFLAAVRFPQVEALRAELTADLRAVRAGRLRPRPESAAGDLGAGEAAGAREADAAPEPRVRSGAA